ncbi:hypothetical protein MKX03_005982 [Papaver bracteatum]|nr:hypothetical protein MKX03_005982 [Papaver bracteatum]
MEGNGKSLMRMISVLLILGMFLGQISAFDVPEFIDCFKPCYIDCMKPNPGDRKLLDICFNVCGLACYKQPPLDHSHRKTLAN